MTDFTEELERYGVRASMGYILIDKNPPRRLKSKHAKRGLILAETDNKALCCEDPLNHYEGKVVYLKNDCPMYEVRPKVFLVARLDVVGWAE